MENIAAGSSRFGPGWTPAAGDSRLRYGWEHCRRELAIEVRGNGSSRLRPGWEHCHPGLAVEVRWNTPQEAEEKKEEKEE